MTVELTTSTRSNGLGIRQELHSKLVSMVTWPVMLSPLQHDFYLKGVGTATSAVIEGSSSKHSHFFHLGGHRPS